MSRTSEGSVFKAKDKRWYARLQYTDKDGRRQQKIRVCKTHALALAKLTSLKREIENEFSDRKTYRQLDAFFRQTYVHEAKFVGGKKTTGFRQDLRIVNIYLDQALDYFADRYLDEITYTDLRGYKDKIANTRTIHGRERSVSDVNQNLRRVRRLFNIAIEEGWLTVNPFKRGTSLITDSFEVERTRILSVEEEQRLLAACNPWREHIKPIIVFAIETACRRGEIGLLKWSDINLEGRVIKIESRSTKTLRSRLVPISGRLLEVLVNLKLFSTGRPNALVFGASDFKKAFNSACAAAGLSDVHFHDLRHTGITRMLEKGISPPLVMKISGHTQQKTFLRYVNQSESSVYEIAMRLDQAA
jgi:integrase